MITLYQFEISPFCDKIRRVLNYKEQEYQTVNFSMADAAKGKIKKYYSAGKLPVIKVHGTILGDSSDIAIYLEKKFPEKPLVPEDPKEKALVHIIEDWADESLYFTETYLRFNVTENRKKILPEVSKEDGSAMQMLAPVALPLSMKKVLNSQGIGRKDLVQVLADLERHITAIENWLGDGDWLVGNQITLADISVYAQLNCINQTPEGSEIINNSPAVKAWFERVATTTENRAVAAA